jgi:alkyl sulfatase BDS1-like metallo-beta-lactamase superfamily hydrolase
VPGGETLDGLLVWLPASRTVFTGNLMGALFPQVPHLSTIRGDRLRSALEYIRCVDRVLALEPDLLITGHDRPIEGAERIQTELTRLRDGVQYVHDATVEGMNAGKDLWTLMAEIELPPELRVGPNRGPTAWNVRAVWEEYVGWFRFESTTELYPVPPHAVFSELAELAGGPEPLAARAAAHVAAGRPLEALHLTDIALAADPEHRPSLEAALRAHEVLLDRTQGWNFDEVRWLESEIERLEARLS